ncbi:AAA family ATPase [Microbacterium sp. Au-Mic1]|uniref:ATP-dependent nuclease n=1 Tax=Microbacterium sp. Au-Mic1 TaxID=2906457 RepID=UPI001E29FA75|nr:AAA family ATPase [Microbacterium sp. Au-Mic1]MCE4027253.1 AAA family ATPase [Microbacterium sp. Au-Mic1]
MSISPSEIQGLQERVRRRGYKHYLYEMELKKIRSFEDAVIRFDFPVTALVGPNGAGKTTVLGAAGLLYDAVQPRRFFARGGLYDRSMSGWRVEYSVTADNTTTTRSASYTDRVDDVRRSKWNRKAVQRPVKVIGVNRTLPVSERSDVYKFAKGDFVGAAETAFTEEVVTAVERILGKTATHYLEVSADLGGKYSILVRRPEIGSDPAYSEFHFGAGEASIIRIVGEIEAVDDGALVLIEEVENGLHPIATQRLVEYLIEVAKRKGCQVIFTTHSNAALKPLPGDAVWSAYRGKLTQGKLDVESLRALTGEIDARLAIFAEDKFASLVAEISLRRYGAVAFQKLDLKSIEIHALGGASPARDQAKHNNLNNPARKYPAIALLDGDKLTEDGYSPSSTSELNMPDGTPFVSFLPGDDDPEAVIFGDMVEAISTNGKVLPRLALALQLDTADQGQVSDAIELALRTNRDRHTVFAEIGESLDFLAEEVVSRAFVSTWTNFHEAKVRHIWDPVAPLLPLLTDAVE